MYVYFPEAHPDEGPERGERPEEHPPPLRVRPLRALPGQVPDQLAVRAARERLHQPGEQALLRQGAAATGADRASKSRVVVVDVNEGGGEQ